MDLLTPHELLKIWQRHRKLTRKTIDAFPEDKLFAFSLGGMRPFSEMAWELCKMAIPIVDGVSTGKWEEHKAAKPTTKVDLLSVWDRQTTELDEKFPQIPVDRFHQVDKAFGQWECSGRDAILYAIDNEIHHRGQGYVYLRALAIEPPSFWQSE